MKTCLALGIALLGAPPALAQDQQVGARTKAMGGSYTAFEEDPVSVWLNPAGIATQPLQASIAYQTYTLYPVDEEGLSEPPKRSAGAETGLVEPAFIPSYLGAVFPLGSAEKPMALGVCVVRPYVLSYALEEVSDPALITFTPESSVEQAFLRFRLAFAYDFRFRKVGEAGFFPHLSAGIGLDVAFEQWEFSQPGGDKSDRSTGLGFGAGILVGLYDDTESFKVNLGLAYQSAVHFDFSIDPQRLPAFDMPQQVNAGLTFYVLEGFPLRFTLDFQWIEWSKTAERPRFSNQPAFEDAFNVSFGVEYRFEISETVFLYPRLGYRRFAAPWEDKNNLPMVGPFKMVLDTDGDVFHIFSLGAGISWATDGGKRRTVDAAADFGGDSFNVAVGYTHEF